MTNYYRAGFFAAMVFLFATAYGDDDDHDYERARQLQESGTIVALEKIIAVANKQFPQSEILEIEFEEKGNNLIYEIEMLDKKGIVQELYFDARTGKLLRMKKGD